MKVIHVTEAIGMILGHDLTKIEPGKFKGVAFKKGHVIKLEDIPIMLSMGKDHVYIMEIGTKDIHENEAAQGLAEVAAGANLILDEPGEGKVNIRAANAGLLTIDVSILRKINGMKGVALSTLHTDTVVKKGQLVASAKIIPLTLPRVLLEKVKKLRAGKEIIRVQPFTPQKAGLVVTGSEVYYGRIEDKFEGVIKKKIEALGSHLTQTIFVPDDVKKITAAIQTFAAQNDLVFVTGGMSVDPDDITPVAVRKAGARTVIYGTPVLPGAMFLVAYLGETPILGIPACGMFSKVTVLDVVLPKVLIGEKITRQYITSLGHGGLCQACPDGCRYPNCSFCK